ncbi:MAG: pyruvate kinase [Planctomycetota bacterium]|nr:pyruvate kinase [Planctomycetota bacterium]
MDRTGTDALPAMVKTKIVATVGPACGEVSQLSGLVQAGVDVFRLNLAHGKYEWLEAVVAGIRQVEQSLGRPIGILGDLSGPKIRLGILPPNGLLLNMGDRVEFARSADAANPRVLVCTYANLIDDLRESDRVILADGIVVLRVLEKISDERVVCAVEQPGLIRSRQGVNLPGVKLSTPSLTEKDRADLAWALGQDADFIGLSFVRHSDDIHELRSVIAQAAPRHVPQIVAKIEKPEAINDLEGIIDATDAVMVARGDLGVEADITRVPVLQKRIIALCNERRVPVITATQMLDSMQHSEFPTRAEASDVANAVLDGTDAVMLSAETAVGDHPQHTVNMMSRIAEAAEPLVRSRSALEPPELSENWTPPISDDHRITLGMTTGASITADQLDADLIFVATRSGRAAMAMSALRGQVPIIALTDRVDTARRMCLYWGITPVVTEAIDRSPEQLLKFAVEWGVKNQLLKSGDRLVMIGSSGWSKQSHGHDLIIVHTLP